MPRKLSLKRDVLQELTPHELSGVAGGRDTNTCISCLDYISCWLADCLPTFDQRCIN